MTQKTTTASAEVLALQVLGWIATDDDQMGDFLQASGAAPADVAHLAQYATFLGSVLDHLLADEARLIAFCDATGTPYQAPLGARAALPGGDLPHWT